MKKQRTKHLDFLLCDIFALELALLISCFFLNMQGYVVVFMRELGFFLAAISISVTYFTEDYKNILRRGYLKEMKAVLKQVAIMMIVIILFLFLLYNRYVYYRRLFLVMTFLFIPMLYIGRITMKAYLKKRYFSIKYAKNVMVICSKSQSEKILDALKEPSITIYRIVDLLILDENMKGAVIKGITVSVDESELLKAVCSQVIDEVFISFPENSIREYEIVRELLSIGIVVHVLTNDDIKLTCNREFETISGMEAMTCSNRTATTFQVFMKRFIDIIGGFVGLFFTFLVGIVIGPIIYIKSPGPILFTQKRVGKNGRFFTLYKFRSMYMDAEERKKELISQNNMQGLMFKMENDPRVIKGIGGFIRKTSLDEFPQFYNVLKGDMSLVGTRPPSTDEFEKYELHHKKRLCMRPGITGLWQISGRNKITDFEEVVRLDAEYIDHWDLELDIKILWRTVWVVFNKTGAS